MATRNLTSSSRFFWLNDWSMPFRWIILAPIITVPLSVILFSLLAGYHGPEEVGQPPNRTGCFLGCPVHEYSEVTATVMAFVLPGLLNLVPFVWVVSRNTRARLAGIVAGLLGLLRMFVPLIVLTLVFDEVTGRGGTSYLDLITEDFLRPAPAPFLEVWGFGFLAWLGTLLVWALFGRLTRRSASEREVFPAVGLGIVGGLALLLALLLSAAAGSPYAALPLAVVGAALLFVSYLGLSGGRRGASAGGAGWGTDSNLPVGGPPRSGER